MKQCRTCGQPVSEDVAICPLCGGEVGEGRKTIDGYRILKILHEGYTTILCKAVRNGEEEPVMIRIFKPESGINEPVAVRLEKELEEIKRLPREDFVRHLAIRRSPEGLWYRVSEWIEGQSWGDAVASGRLGGLRQALDLFAKIASKLATLHRSGHIIPHLILDDVILLKDQAGTDDVRIDYKLSRFLDPQMARPSPMLEKLLACHPDILHGRPLDFRSDIWSLGKIFVEILAADFDSCDFHGQIQALPLPPAIEALFRTMLASDPDLRPSSMEEIADLLAEVTDEEIRAAGQRHLEKQRTRILGGPFRRWLVPVGVILLLALAGGLFWTTLTERKDTAVLFEELANRYSPSIAFVLVEYWIRDGNAVVYRNRTEGTAFLVDREGYLLTNRHVACPWLEDGSLAILAEQLRERGGSPRLEHRAYLWFEGAKAFNLASGRMLMEDLSDRYFLDSAFRSDGRPSLSIAGVARRPTETRQLMASPLRDDFAILKIDRPPEGLLPLPLDLERNPLSIPKLAGVMALGFPLGSRTQESFVNVSVTGGHVRRSFENLIQIDASVYGGNSGGPVIDDRGKVIGIVSGVAMEPSAGMFAAPTPLWHMGMVLPIAKAAGFLADLKAGLSKWNGVLDLSLKERLGRIHEAAGQGRWADAATLADRELEGNADPTLIFAAGIMHLCADDRPGARRLFRQAVSMDDRNILAQWMGFVVDWMDGRWADNPHRKELMNLDWRSPGEFQGFLARILEEPADEKAVESGWDTPSEKSWLFYAVGLAVERKEDSLAARNLFRESLVSAEPGSWESYLSGSAMERAQKLLLESAVSDAAWKVLQIEAESFEQLRHSLQAKGNDVRQKISEYQKKRDFGFTDVAQRRQLLEDIRTMDPRHRHFLAELSFTCAMAESWPDALGYARSFLAAEGRPNAARLGVGLLEPALLRRMGMEEEARKALSDFVRRTRDPWYRRIGECLLGKQSESSLMEDARRRPEDLLTAATALGMWAEGAGEADRAIQYYREALESYMDTWIAYDLAEERIKRLRKAGAD